MLMSELRDPSGEIEFLKQMFEKDSKNYHVWSYRQWLVQKFGLWEGERGMEELTDVERMLKEDVRNNSAWNHRWFLIFGRGVENVDDKIVEREIEFARSAIRMAPQNQSPWNYLRGVVRERKRQLSSQADFAREFADIAQPDRVRSSHALDLLADVYTEEDRKGDAAKALDLLAEKYDPIRANYWAYKKSLLGLPQALAT